MNSFFNFTVGYQEKKGTSDTPADVIYPPAVLKGKRPASRIPHVGRRGSFMPSKKAKQEKKRGRNEGARLSS